MTGINKRKKKNKKLVYKYKVENNLWFHHIKNIKKFLLKKYVLQYNGKKQCYLKKSQIKKKKKSYVTTQQQVCTIARHSRKDLFENDFHNRNKLP